MISKPRSQIRGVHLELLSDELLGRVILLTLVYDIQALQKIQLFALLEQGNLVFLCQNQIFVRGPELGSFLDVLCQNDTLVGLLDDIVHRIDEDLIELVAPALRIIPALHSQQ